MKRVKRRTVIALLLIAILVGGLGLYTVRFVRDGGRWASFSANQTIYSSNASTSGTLTDRYGTVLATVSGGELTYSDDWLTRVSTLHAVGDREMNIGTGALSVFASKLIGYDIVNGVYSLGNRGASVKLSIDADLNSVAYRALDGRNGAVAVVNYKTGEILCMVSTASFDPEDVPDDIETNSEYTGAYINRFLSSGYTPGSVFKIVTLAAAIENIDDLYDRTFYCSGSVDIGDSTITCSGVHGEQTIEEAFASSCNCAFGELAVELGSDVLSEYCEKFGLTDRYSFDGVTTAAGVFKSAEKDSADLAWSGIGQYNDSVNPCTLLRLVSAIANDGTAVDFTLLMKSGFTHSDRLMSEETADALSDMMSYNVYYNYGEDNYPGLELHAKTGTAEVGDGEDPHAWFTGFITNEDHPYAFVVVVENGGSGYWTAGPIANTVLQAAIEN